MDYSWLRKLPAWVVDVLLGLLVLGLVLFIRSDSHSTVIVAHVRDEVSWVKIERSDRARRHWGDNSDPITRAVAFRLVSDKRTFRYYLSRAGAPRLLAALEPGAHVDLGLAADGTILSASVNGRPILSAVQGAAEVRWFDRQVRLAATWLLVAACVVWVGSIVLRVRRLI